MNYDMKIVVKFNLNIIAVLIELPINHEYTDILTE